MLVLLLDVVLPCAVQLKHAKVVRQLDAATAGEKAATERCEELQDELQDCSSTCRNRMRWLEQAASDAARRTQQLYRCLQNTAPLEVRPEALSWCRCHATMCAHVYARHALACMAAWLRCWPSLLHNHLCA